MASSEREYEDFVPPHKTEREPATHTLTVNLSGQGFKKEHVRVQMVHSQRRLIVRGERPVDGNRWRRFGLELLVPDGCDAKAIHARFENGVFRVTMPAVPPEQVPVVASAAKQDGGDRAARGREDNKHETPRKQEARQRVVSSARDPGGSSSKNDGAGGGSSAPPSSCQGFLSNPKMATTVLAVVLVLISLGIYVKNSVWP
uniref:Small heat shock-like protein n=1 Tax=Zea mays TaxID=4577 RepID=B6U8I5_MAIZE|nr:small heat shock-like protein [Zea mays]|eukprot:NP_001152078.1 small heat shock-like protein [Zea mays]